MPSTIPQRRPVVKYQPPPFEQFVEMVHRFAWFCLERLPEPKAHSEEDLFQEGYLVYCRCVEKHNPQRTKFITYYWMALRNHFARLLNRERRGPSRIQLDQWDSEDEPTGLNALPSRKPGPVALAAAAEVSNFPVSRAAHVARRVLLSGGLKYDNWESRNHRKAAKGPEEEFNRACQYAGGSEDDIREELALGLSLR